jgi:hypothetical protein
MRRVFLAGLLLLCALPAQAQRTTVTGTVTDPNSIPYANGTIKAILVPTGGNPTLNGAQIPGTYGPTPLDGTGSLVPMSLPDNNVISPGGTQYVFTVCETPGIPPPEGFGSVCFDSAPITITGASQVITTQLNAAAKALGRVSAGGAVKVNNVSVAAANFIDSLSIMWAVAAPNVSASPVGIGPIAQKPTAGQAGDAICYVSKASGNDANDGLSWGTAKLTVTGCWNALPQYYSVTNVYGGGTIYMSSGPTVGNPAGATVGLQIAGINDPNYITVTQIASLSRAGNVVTATLTISPPSYYVAAATISVFDAQDGILGGDASFNGNFTLTNVNVGAKTMTWNQTGPNSSQAFGGIILPQGWLPQESITIICRGGADFVANGHLSKCTATWGDATHPSLRISGVNVPMTFQQIKFFNGQIAAQIAVDTNGARAGTGGVSGTTFIADDFAVQTCAGCGPGVDIGSNSFFLKFYDCTFNGNANASGGVLADPYQAFVINPGAGTGSGLIWLQNSNVNVGAIEMKAGGNGGGIYVDGLETEGNLEAAVWIPGTSATVYGRVRNVELADCPGTGGAHCYGVRVDNTAAGAAQNDAVIVENIAGALSGPMYCLAGCNPQGYITQVISNLRQGQAGLFTGGNIITQGSAPAHLIGAQVDNAREQFSPSAARFAQIPFAGITQVPSTWATVTGTGSVTAVAAPDGTTMAGRLTWASGSVFQVATCCANHTPAVGDWYIMGVWARSQTNNGFASNTPFQFAFSNSNVHLQSTGNQQIFAIQFIKGDGDWYWFYSAQKISATDGAASGLNFNLYSDSTHTADYYCPTVVRIPNGTISDNEALQYAMNMACYPEDAAAGDISMLRQQRFRMSVPGSNFQYLWQGVPTADAIVTLPPNPGTLLGTGNGVGQLMQTKRVAGCATGAVLGNTCDTTVTWTNTFADTNYTVTCTGAAITSGTPELVGHSISAAKTASAITVRTVNNSAAAAQFTNIECVAVHD